ncbi:MAG: hypothetical protein ACRCZI_03280 [Cetobacterium sp.]
MQANNEIKEIQKQLTDSNKTIETNKRIISVWDKKNEEYNQLINDAEAELLKDKSAVYKLPNPTWGDTTMPMRDRIYDLKIEQLKVQKRRDDAEFTLKECEEKVAELTKKLDDIQNKEEEKERNLKAKRENKSNELVRVFMEIIEKIINREISEKDTSFKPIYSKLEEYYDQGGYLRDLSPKLNTILTEHPYAKNMIEGLFTYGCLSAQLAFPEIQDGYHHMVYLPSLKRAEESKKATQESKKNSKKATQESKKNSKKATQESKKNSKKTEDLLDSISNDLSFDLSDSWSDYNSSHDSSHDSSHGSSHGSSHDEKFYRDILESMDEEFDHILKSTSECIRIGIQHDQFATIPYFLVGLAKLYSSSECETEVTKFRKSWTDASTKLTDLAMLEAFYNSHI